MTTIFRFLGHWPLAWLHRLGALAGWLVWLCSPTYRRHLRENMTQALGAEQAARLRGAAIAHAGRQSLELPRIWLLPHRDVVAHIVEVSGWEHYEAACARGKGVIFLTPHLGCFEMIGQYLSMRMPFCALYRPPRHKWLRELVEQSRTRPGFSTAPTDLSGVRTLLRALKRGEAIGLLPDQAPRAGEGRWIKFFGKPAYTMTLAGRLTESGAGVVLIWAERLPGGAGYHLHLSAPAQAIDGTTEARAEQISQEIERMILQCPEQYLWGYNRYKRRRGTGAPVESD